MTVPSTFINPMVMPVRPIPSPRELGLVMPGDIVYTEWVSWFAWYPVKTVRGKWKWMRQIYRRQTGLMGFPRSFYNVHGDSFDLLR